MRRLPRNISLLGVSLIALSGLAVQPVFAEKGLDDSGTTTVVSDGSGTSANQDSSDPTGTDDSGSTNTETRTGGGRGPGGLGLRSSSDSDNDGSEDSHGFDRDSLHAEAARLLAKDRQNRKASTVEDRQKACQAHQAEITTREANYAKAAQRHYDTFTSIYGKVLAFQDGKQLSVSNFDDLKAAVDAKQALAQTAVSALKSSDVKVDCTATDPAAFVATLKTAVANARTALQDYRAAIKNMVVALQGASTGNHDDTTTTSTPTENAQ